MAVNPGTPVYAVSDPDVGAGVVDVDIKSSTFDTGRTSAKARVVWVANGGGGGGGGSTASGPQAAASSQSVTPATDGSPFNQNLVQIKGTAVSSDAGNVDAGTQRVVLATNGSHATAANQTNGTQRAIILGANGSAISVGATNGGPPGVGDPGLFVRNLNYNFNGSTLALQPGDGNGIFVNGGTASGAADAGNPVKIGGASNSAIPTAVTSGQRVNTWFGLNGQIAVALVDRVTGADLTANSTTDGLGSLAGPIAGRSYNLVFNGSTWDRTRGDTKGAYVIPKGGATIATGQVSVGTTATLVVAARAGRQKVTLAPTASTVYYVGASNVSATNGLYVPAGGTVTLDTAAEVYAIGASTVTISFIEYFG